jgi:hypothetical protein
MSRLPVGHQSEFRPRPWPDIEAFFAGMAGRHPQFSHMADIVMSIRASAVEAQLAGRTSMHDLIVVPTPSMPPPYDVIRVCSPSSLRPVAPGDVLVEHLAATGNNDRISRPTTDAVPLFWRFVREKYGVLPSHTNE